MKVLLIIALVVGAVFAQLESDDIFPDTNDFRTINGLGNNENDETLGEAGTQFSRLGDNTYEDGIEEVRGGAFPNSVLSSAREISNAIFGPTRQRHEVTEGSAQDLSALTTFWGQFLDHDLTEAAASATETQEIPIPTGDPAFDPAGMLMNVTITLPRSEFSPGTGTSMANPREQDNVLTHFIDASNVYGEEEEKTDVLREMSDGLLRTDDAEPALLPFVGTDVAEAAILGMANDQFPALATGAELFAGGDFRVNENVVLTCYHTIWVREHNRLAALAEDEGDGDEEIFQLARAVVIAEMQAIIYEEWLPVLGIDLGDYPGYDVDVDPTVDHFFATASFRFGHTLLTSVVRRLGDDYNSVAQGDMLLRDGFFNPEAVSIVGIEPYFRGGVMTRAEELDALVIDDVRDFLFARPGNDFRATDLIARNIQRGRDHGIVTYNQARTALGLSAVSDFSDITSDSDLESALESVYADVDDVDGFVGGLAEDQVGGSPFVSFGETFAASMEFTYGNLREGDRYWYENTDSNGPGFSDSQIEEIREIRFSDIIRANTDIEDFPDNAFIVADIGDVASASALSSWLRVFF